MSGTEAVNRLVVSGDICGSGRMDRETKTRTRQGMYAAFAEAFGAIGVTPREIHQEDRGDGILAALDPGVPSSPVVGRWVDTVHESLREYNAGAARAARLRLRVAMHMGPVAYDGKGLVGRAVDLTCRLCDSDEAKRVAAAVPGSVLLHVVSDWLYTNVVREGGRYIEPGHYRPARVGNKETDELGWFHVPRLAEPPVSLSPPVCPTGGSTPAAGPPPPAPAVRNQFNVRGDNQVFERNVIHGFTGIRKDRPAGDGDGAGK